jgi:hypothetical protein
MIFTGLHTYLFIISSWVQEYGKEIAQGQEALPFVQDRHPQSV